MGERKIAWSDKNLDGDRLILETYQIFFVIWYATQIIMSPKNVH